MLDALRKWLHVSGPESELESLDRRAFLRGLTVTAAGLVVARTTIFAPAPMEPIQDWQDWAAHYAAKSHLMGSRYPDDALLRATGLTREQIDAAVLGLQRKMDDYRGHSVMGELHA